MLSRYHSPQHVASENSITSSVSRNVVRSARSTAVGFETLPASTEKAGHEIKATLRWLRFMVKGELSRARRERVRQQHRQHGMPGRTPRYRETHFRMRAAVILDTARQEADRERRAKRIAGYEAELICLCWMCSMLSFFQCVKTTATASQYPAS